MNFVPMLHADYIENFDEEYHTSNNKLKKRMILSVIYICLSYFCAYLVKSADGVKRADGKITGVNIYTQAHRDTSVFTFWFIGRVNVLNFITKSIKPLGKVKNAFLRYGLILPFLFLLRAAIFVYFFYNMVYKDLMPHIKIFYHLNSSNWWKNKDEAFFTNCSAVLAFFSWTWWFIFWSVAIFSCLIIFGQFCSSLGLIISC